MEKLASDHQLSSAELQNISRYGFAVASAVPSLGLDKAEVVKRASVYGKAISNRHTALVALFRQNVSAPA
jgi:hypothetical protein